MMIFDGLNRGLILNLFFGLFGFFGAARAVFYLPKGRSLVFSASFTVAIR
jgi:hypothetical protein